MTGTSLTVVFDQAMWAAVYADVSLEYVLNQALQAVEIRDSCTAAHFGASIVLAAVGGTVQPDQSIDFSALDDSAVAQSCAVLREALASCVAQHVSPEPAAPEEPKGPSPYCW